MDRQRIDDEHIVARYLAGQLDDAEAAAFEAHYSRNPDTVREIERALRMKEGLAELQERGELDALLRERSSWYWRPALGLAAGLAVLLVGMWLWVGHSTRAPIAATLAGLSGSDGQPLRIASSHVLVKVRGPSVMLDIPLPAERSAIELRMIPSARPADGRFRVELGKVDPTDNRTIPLGVTHTRASAEDGVVVAYLDSAQLSPGNIMIKVAPEDAAPGSNDVFVIRLR